jgi:hypothetical protein
MMVTATQEQIERSNALAEQWRKEAGHPIVAVGAATNVLMNVINQGVTEDDQAAVIDAIYASLRQIVGEG